jgi:hypothetical protein
VEVDRQVLRFYLPVCALAVAATTFFMFTQRVSRRRGAFLVLLYLGFVVGGCFVGAQLPHVREATAG